MDDNNDFNAYDMAMDLVRDQLSALQVCRAALKGCQDENEKLIEVVKYYAETDWRDLSMRDRGGAARQILKEAVGYE